MGWSFNRMGIFKLLKSWSHEATTGCHMFYTGIFREKSLKSSPKSISQQRCNLSKSNLIKCRLKFVKIIIFGGRVGPHFRMQFYKYFLKLKCYDIWYYLYTRMLTYLCFLYVENVALDNSLVPQRVQRLM